MSNTVHVYTALGQLLPEAVQMFAAALPVGGATLLLYTPLRCFFARLALDGMLSDVAGRRVDLAPVYEVRAFHETAELRWRNEPRSPALSSTVVLADAPLVLGGSLTAQQIDVHGRLSQTYLLWGEGVGPVAGLGGGWSRLATPRIGRLDVPHSGVAAQQRVLLHAVEYLREVEHGNVVVFDERLLKLEVAGG